MEKLIENLKSRAKTLVGLITWILALILLTSTVKNIGKVRSINSVVQKERDRVEKMKAENTRLEAQIAETQGEAFIEKQIRDRLGLAKTGEAIVVLPDVDTLRKLAPKIPIEENTLPDPNWKKWMKLFI